LSGLDKKRIQKIIHYWLDHSPEPNETELSSIQNLIFDGSFLHGRRGIVTLMDAHQHRVFAIAYGVSERSCPQLETFFQQQKAKGLNPRSCTLDGNPRAIKAIKNIWPSILIQRCLVHIQRQGLMWCRMNPKRLDAKRLRDLFLQVTNLSSVQEKNSFLKHMQIWEEKYGVKFNLIKETGWVLSDLIRARSMLLKAIPYMFHFLVDPSIPKTTNGLEGYFSRLKHLYRQHRGLNPHHRQNYFLWFSHLRPR
jgi:hypothetical protein